MNTEANAAEPNAKLRLTPQQAAALDRGPFSVALSAGAGCGKTTVLAERFLQELDGDGARPLRSIVALTFTEKAARELRQRIRAQCRLKISTGFSGESRHWRMIMRGLDAAPIGTFHEFCARMLRVHAVEAGIDPEFGVLDEQVAQTLRERAVRHTVRLALSEGDLNLIDLAVEFGLGQVNDTLSGLIGSTTLVELKEWIAQDRDAVFSQWLSIWDRDCRVALVRQALPVARACRKILESLDLPGPKLRERRTEILLRLPDIENGGATESKLSELRQLARISDLRGKDIWPDEQVKLAIQKQFESLRKAIDRILPKLSWSEKLTEEEIANRKRLSELGLEARLEYERLKHERNGLDFSDLQTKFVELLRSYPGILTNPTAPDLTNFEFILVDEFQDTDRLQSEILHRMGQSEFLRGRLFVVGDVKQSIYGFRGAEPSIFREWQEAFPEEGRRELSENFRSVPGIIHFVNALFADSFDTFSPSSENGNRSQLNRLGAMRKPITDTPAVEFHWADPNSEVPNAEAIDAQRMRTVGELRRAEADSLARHIRRRLDEGWPIYDRKSKQMRNAGPGDIAFLFRAMTDVGSYETALTEQGLDYHTLGGAAFFAQQEIHDVINVLSVIEDPLDEVSLAGALRSPFFSLTDDGLYWLATSFIGGLSTGLQRADEIASLPADDRRRALRARELLDHWHSRKDRDGIACVVGQVLAESGYEAALVCEFMGPRKLANVRKLAQLAAELDSQGGFLFADFVSQLRAHRDDPPREEQASTSDEEGTSIRLMSIHQSKGLEFPVVVVPDLNRASEPRHQLFSTHPGLGLVVRPVTSEPDDEEEKNEDSGGGSLGWESYKAFIREREEQESLRLFYVAITRARDSVILSAGICLNRGVRSTAMRLLDERFDLATGTCLAKIPESWPIPSIRVIPHQSSDNPMDGSTEIDERVAIRRGSIDDVRESVKAVIGSLGLRESNSNRSRQRRRDISIIDLEELDGLSVRSRKIDGLLRDVIANPRLFKGQSSASLIQLAGARQIPKANAAIMRAAESLLQIWMESESFDEIRSLGSDNRKAGLTSMHTRFTREGVAIRIRAGCDLMIRQHEGDWTPCVLSLGHEAPGSHVHQQIRRLRLLLSIEAITSSSDSRERNGRLLELAGSRVSIHRITGRQARCDVPDYLEEVLTFVDAASLNP